MAKGKKTITTDVETKTYQHPEAESPMRPENTQIAVKVIDDRGNELQVIKNLREVER